TPCPIRPVPKLKPWHGAVDDIGPAPGRPEIAFAAMETAETRSRSLVRSFGKRAPERSQLSPLLPPQIEGTKLRSADRRRGRLSVMVDHILQRRDLPGMHVGRPGGGATQRGRLEGAGELRRRPVHETELRAGFRTRIAVAPQAIERIIRNLFDRRL